MRCFIAATIPSHTQKHIESIQAQLSGGKFSKAKGCHLTLIFLGDISEEKAVLIKKQLTALKANAIKATLEQAGFFPNDWAMRVAYVSVKPVEPLRELHTEVCRLIGALPDSNFVPHLTIARIKSVESREEMISSIKPEPLEFKISKVELIQSTLTPSGPVYETLFSCDLA